MKKKILLLAALLLLVAASCSAAPQKSHWAMVHDICYTESGAGKGPMLNYLIDIDNIKMLDAQGSMTVRVHVLNVETGEIVRREFAKFDMTDKAKISKTHYLQCLAIDINTGKETYHDVVYQEDLKNGAADWVCDYGKIYQQATRALALKTDFHNYMVAHGCP